MIQIKTSKLKFKNKTKAQILKNWLSSLFMTVTAVVVVVLVIPKSAEVTIHLVQAFEHEIVYSLDVIDQDNSIISGTLKVVLENQFEYYELPLDLGSNNGVFSELNDNTLYHFTIKADKGFGLEVLAKEDIKTIEGLSGVIVSHILEDSANEYELNYLVRTFYSDSKQELREVYIKYGYTYPGESEIFNYQYIPILEFDQFSLIEGIPNYNCIVHVSLEGIDQLDEVVILDEYQFRTPVYISASLYIQQVSNNLIGIDVYADFQAIDGITYELVLSQNNLEISRKDVVSAPEMMQYEVSPIVFSNLSSDTMYQIDLYATYQDPDTHKTVSLSVYSIETTTLSDFQSQVEIIEFQDYYEVTITVVDPNHNFQKGVLWLYEETVDFDYLMIYTQFDFVQVGNEKTTSFIVYKETYPNYRIEIGLQSETNQIHYVVLETIEINE